MAEKSGAALPGDYQYPPPPPGPPPGHNGLAMNPSSTTDSHAPSPSPYVPDSHSELYDEPQRPALPERPAVQQTPHQPPPPDSDGAPKKASWGQRFSSFGTKAAAPFNMLANKLGSENFLPSSMDKECEKAARILRNFCSKSCLVDDVIIHTMTKHQANNIIIKNTEDGIYTDTPVPESVETPPTTGTDAQGQQQQSTTTAAKPRKNRTLLTIPSKVINKAVGLAIFTTARAGFHVSGATGSGVLIARLPDGSWSPPSGIQVHSVGAGLMIGIDIYDCVVVINSREALEAFTKTRMSLGSDLAVVAGPWGAGGSVDFAAPQGGKGKDNKEKAAAAPDDKKGDEQVEEEEEPPRMLGQYATRPKKATPSPPPAPQATTTTTTDAKNKEGEDPMAPTAEEDTNFDAPPTRPDAGKERKPSAFKTAIKQPTYSYVKSRGFYAGVQVDGTIVTERKDANAAFYGEPVAVQHILKGEVPLVPGKVSWVNAVQGLFDTIKGAEGWHAQTQTQPVEQKAAEVPPPAAAAAAPTPQTTTTTADASRPPNPPRTNSVRERVAAINSAAGSAPQTPPSPEDGTTAAARAKAAEAAGNSSGSNSHQRDSMPPPMYTETEGEASGPPAYVEDGVVRPGVGDTKGAASSG